jgi:prepilin-type N-terminal cleavage/methylation domain-containing protein
MTYRKQKGFSLIELSVVLAVVALIIAATLKGSELVKAAELKAIISEVDNYKAALAQFNLSYKGLPGDINNAQSYWATTVNGNNNGYIEDESAGTPESFRALQQLVLAKIIDGNFSGLWGTGFVLASTDVQGNVPISDSNRTGVFAYVKCCASTDAIPSRTVTFRNHINIASIYAANTAKRAGALTPVEAKSIDDKVDDGIPDYGFVSGSGSYSGAAYVATGCYNGTGTTSLYETNSATYKDVQGCQMQFAYDKE